jgi:isopentenyl phosphate kinase
LVREGLTVLKLGGSVITKKDEVMTANELAIKRLAKEIGGARVSPLLIVHGGGSFGHPLAKKYLNAMGMMPPTGFSGVHQAMMGLNQLLLNALISESVPAVSLPPSSFTLMKRGKIQFLNIDLITDYLNASIVPVLYGDVVLDQEAGFSILSGDKIVAELAISLNAMRVVIGIDVDGLFTSDPKVDPNARFIDRISVKDLRRLKIGPSRSIDVTGGMKKKVEELAKVAGYGCHVFMVNALKAKRVYKALRGEKVVGTIIGK